MGLMYMKSISFIAIFATLLAVVVGLGGITDAYAQGTSGPSPQQQQQQQQQQSSNPYAQQQQSPINPNGLGDLAGQGNGVSNEFFEPGNPSTPRGVGPTITPGAESPPSPLRPEHSAPGWGSGGIREPYQPGQNNGEKIGWEDCHPDLSIDSCPPGQFKE